MRRRRKAGLSALVLGLAGLLQGWFPVHDRSPGTTTSHAAATPAPQPQYPAGFTDTFVASVPAATALAFTPDGRLLVTTQPGRLLVHDGNRMLAEPALDLSGIVCPRLEQGLLGIAVDPAFADNGHLYVYYTIDRFGCVNRVSRFTMAGGQVDPASELVLLDNIPSPNGNHIAGDMHFGPDGYLYVSIGDGGCDYAGGGCAGDNDAARDRHVLQGKILRITTTGEPAPGNPFEGPRADRCNRTGMTEPGRWCAETYAWGLRNPFRFAFDPGRDRFFINDVGQDNWEEIDLGIAGADYGWSIREGRCANGRRDGCGPTPEGMTDPLFDYHHDTGCTAITGAAFVPRGIWPAPWDGSYLFADYTCGTIFRLVEDAGRYTSEPFVTGLGAGSAVHMLFGPAPGGTALWYTTYAGGGEIRRIAWTGAGNRPPVAALSADPAAGPAPLEVRLDATASTDPDGDPVTYLWDLGDGTPPLETAGAVVHHVYGAGEAVATVRVRDAEGAISAPASVRIVAGDEAPAVAIVSPPAGHRFRVGENVTLRGSATDAEDGRLPGRALSWSVVLHHASHTHPFLGPVTGGEVSFVAPRPENLLAASNSWLEVRLTATDSAGVTTTVSQRLDPLTVELTFATEPPGMVLTVAGERVHGPATVVSWAGLDVEIEAADQDHSGRRWLFTGWSDGGPARRTVVTPDAPATLTATFSVDE